MALHQGSLHEVAQANLPMFGVTSGRTNGRSVKQMTGDTLVTRW